MTQSPADRKDLWLTLDARRVNPLYYVTFTTATLIASATLYAGFNTTDPVATLSLLSGFLVIFAGVYLLNLSRADPNGHKSVSARASMDVGTDLISSLQTRMSMQSRRSYHGDREGLMRGYDEETQVFGLTDLDEESDEGPRRVSANGSARGRGGYGDSIELQERKGDS